MAGDARPLRVEIPLAPDPVIERYKRDVDRTLLRENLRRTPEERLLNLMALQRFADDLRDAGRRANQVSGIRCQVSGGVRGDLP